MSMPNKGYACIMRRERIIDFCFTIVVLCLFGGAFYLVMVS